MTEDTFNPTMALAHYRELEALMNLAIINNLEWQERRANGDTSFLLQNKHFIEQNKLMEEIDRQGYILVNYEDENGDPIYAIEPKEKE